MPTTGADPTAARRQRGASLLAPLLAFAALLVAVVLARPLVTGSESASEPKVAGVVPIVALPPVAGDDDAVVEPFTPTEEQSEDARQLARRLPRAHYLGLDVDDTISERVFDNYVEFLDPNRAILLRADIDAFQPWRTTLDDAIREGDLEPAFTMFNRYHERQVKRLTWVVQVLEGDLSDLPLDTDEELELDREDAPWAETEGELDHYWRKRLASQILGLEMAGRTRDEARERLLERQQEQLRRVGQYHERDIFQFFMTALTDAYDPHTQYLVPRLADNFDMQMSLSFEGIGALLRPDGEWARVERIIPGGPAEQDGRLQPNDRIVGVAQGKEGPMVDIVGWRLDDAVQIIRGERGSIVRLQVMEADAPEGAPPAVIDIVRDRVKLEEQSARGMIYSVDGEDDVALVEGSERGGGIELRDDGAIADDVLPEVLGPDGEALRIGVVDLPAFYMDLDAARAGDPDFKSGTRDVARLLAEMEEEGIDGVILDLRGNGGGSLTEAHELAGLLLGSKPVVQVRDARGDVQVLRGSGRAVWTGPLIVLVDRLSASASEIVAAAVQDHRRGLVLGERTFGKGTVQAVTQSGTGRLLVTIAKFYRVTGESTQHAGVTPDIELPATYDPEEIGESSMEGALAWDVIEGLPLRKRPGDDAVIPAAIPELRRRSAARVGTDPDLELLVKELDLLREVRADTTVPLSLEVRQREQEEYEERRQAILTAWRTAKGYPEPLDAATAEELLDADPHSHVVGDPDVEQDPADEPGPFDDAEDLTTDDADEDSAEVDDPDRPRRVDAWLQEAVRVMADLIAELEAR